MTDVRVPELAGCERRRIADLEFADALNEMKHRCYGLESTINGGGFADSQTLDGVLQIAADVTKAMEQLAQDFDAERKLRIAEEPK